ncbi:MAG: hypothetical protein R2831_06510 [Chitinophagaceae bacterium]
MKIIFFICNLLVSTIVCFSSAVSAQQDTLYFQNQLKLQSKHGANTYKTLKKDSLGLFEVCTYTITDTLLSKTHYAEYAMLSKEGMETLYYPNGKIFQQINFHLGNLSGHWIQFKKDGKNIAEKRNYLTKEEYSCTLYDEKNDFVDEEGVMLKEQKHGLWKKYHYKSQAIKSTIFYQHGQRHGEAIEYFTSGKIKRKEIYQYGKMTKGALYDEEGNKLKYFPAFVFPQYKTSVYKYFNVYAPCLYSKDYNKPTLVYITINKEGVVVDSNIENCDASCILIAKTAIAKMKKWKPAKVENEPITYTAMFKLRAYVPKE